MFQPNPHPPARGCSAQLRGSSARSPGCAPASRCGAPAARIPGEAPFQRLSRVRTAQAAPQGSRPGTSAAAAARGCSTQPCRAGDQPPSGCRGAGHSPASRGPASRARTHAATPKVTTGTAPPESAARFPRPWRAAYLTGTRRTAALSACPAALRSRVWLQQRGRAGTERVLGGRAWGRCVCGSPSREGEKRPGASGSIWRGWVIVCAVPRGWPGGCR